MPVAPYEGDGLPLQPEVRTPFDGFPIAAAAISVKGSAGYVMSVYVTNKNAAVRFLQLHNKASAPASAEVPVLSLPIPAGTANNPGVLHLTDSFFGVGGRPFTTGIGIGISTAEASYTAATNTDHDISGSYT